MRGRCPAVVFGAGRAGDGAVLQRPSGAEQRGAVRGALRAHRGGEPHGHHGGRPLHRALPLGRHGAVPLLSPGQTLLGRKAMVCSGQWVEFDDSRVSKVAEATVGGPAAYILFFRIVQ
jgi:hypothetical protein